MNTMTSVEKIMIFKTNIKTDIDYLKIKMILDLHKGIEDWNIDREDVDCVLRIESDTLNENKIIELLLNFDFFCEELNN